MRSRLLAVAMVVSSFAWASTSFAQYRGSSGPQSYTRVQGSPSSAGVPRREKGELAIGRLRIAPGMKTSSTSMGNHTEGRKFGAYVWKSAGQGQFQQQGVYRQSSTTKSHVIGWGSKESRVLKGSKMTVKSKPE